MYIGYLTLNLGSFEPFVKCGHKKTARLHSQTLRELLWLNNKNAKQISNIYPTLKIGFLLLYESTDAVHSIPDTS